MEEIWKDIPGYEGCYRVSNLGRVKSLYDHPNRILSDCINSNTKGRNSFYKRVSLYKNRVTKQFQIHTLVLKSFTGERANGMEARHLNGDSKDNRLINLKWGTHEENTIDRALHGRDQKGEVKPQAKLTEKQVKKIINMTFLYTAKKLAEKFNVSVSAISKIKTNRTWRHIPRDLRKENVNPGLTSKELEGIIDTEDYSEKPNLDEVPF